MYRAVQCDRRELRYHALFAYIVGTYQTNNSQWINEKKKLNVNRSSSIGIPDWMCQLQLQHCGDTIEFTKCNAFTRIVVFVADFEPVYEMNDHIYKFNRTLFDFSTSMWASIHVMPVRPNHVANRHSARHLIVHCTGPHTRTTRQSFTTIRVFQSDSLYKHLTACKYQYIVYTIYICVWCVCLLLKMRLQNNNEKLIVNHFSWNN